MNLTSPAFIIAAVIFAVTGHLALAGWCIVGAVITS